LSPSLVNKKATVATLKFAVQAGMVKVKPIKEAVRTNWPLLVKGLKENIEALNVDIDIREKELQSKTEEIERLRKLLDEKNESGNKPKREGSNLVPKKAMSHIRKRSTLPLGLVQMLGEAPDLDEEEVDDFDEKNTADVNEHEVDAAIDKEIENARGEKEAVAAVLGIEKEEYIRKSMNFTQTNINLKEAFPERNITFNNQSGINEKFSYAGDLQKSDNIAIDFEQDHMPTTTLKYSQLAERCEVLESMLEAEKALNQSYLYSQQVIIDHLAETNEGILQYFRYKNLLDTGGKKKKKKKRTKKKKKSTRL